LTDEICLERGSLAKAAEDAIWAVLDRMYEYNAALHQKADASQILIELQAARAAESKAERAYDKHIKAHGCRK
jgi:hypothetical protein